MSDLHLSDSPGLRDETLEAMDAVELLGWALERFRPRIALASSFGAEDVVLIDLLMELDPRARVFTLDTGRLHSETYALAQALRDRYGLAIDVYFPRTEALEAMVRAHGVNLFYASVENRKLCPSARSARYARSKRSIAAGTSVAAAR